MLSQKNNSCTLCVPMFFICMLVRSFVHSFVLPHVLLFSICSCIPSNSLFIYSGNTLYKYLFPSLPKHHSWNGSMFLAGIIMQPFARIADLLLNNQSHRASHTLIFSLPFPSDTRVSVDNEHPLSSTNYKTGRAKM